MSIHYGCQDGFGEVWNSRDPLRGRPVNQNPQFAKELGRYALIIGLFLGLVSASDITISACQDLTIENASYVLAQNVSSEGTCFAIKASNVTLDGQGNTVTYAQSSSGYAIDGASGYDHATIRNLRMVQENPETGYNPAVYISGVDNGTIANNVIVASAEGVTGIYLHSANSNVVSNNTIVMSGAQSFGVDAYSSGSNAISNNAIDIYGSDSHGIEIEFGSSLNAISNNSIAVSGEYGFGIRIISADSNAASYNNVTASGYGVRAVYLEDSDDNTLLSNTVVSSSDEGHGIDLQLSNANTLSSNTITMLGSPGYGVDLESSDGNVISGTTLEGRGNENQGISLVASSVNTLLNNTVTQSGATSHGVWLIESSGENLLSNNTIAVYGQESWGIRIMSSVSNNVTGGSITSSLGYDYYLEDASATNNFGDTNFTAQRRIWLNDEGSWFNYADGNLSIKTRVSGEAGGEIKRKSAGLRTQSGVGWSDANASGIVTAYYDLAGLLANTRYYIRDASAGNLTHLHELTTDAYGNLPAFSMGLKENTSIMVHILQTSTSNLTIRDKNGRVMENVTVRVHDAAGDAISDFELNDSVRSKEFVFDGERKYDITYLHPSGNTLELKNATPAMNVTINPQFVDAYSGMLPSSTTTASYVIALNTTGLQFDSAEIVLSLSSAAANRILHCLDWDYQTAACSSWESNATSSYNGTFNSTQFVFNVTSFDAYMAGVYTAPAAAPSGPATTTTAPVSGGGGNSGSGFSYLPEYGQLSLSGHPASMEAELGGGQASYVFILKNVGNATLHGVRLSITGMNPGWFSLEPGKVSELKEDAGQAFAFKVRPPSDAAPGKYTLTLNATSDDDGVNAAVSSLVFEVRERAKTEPIPAAVTVTPANAKPEGEAQAAGLAPAEVTEMPSDLTPAGKEIAFSLYGGSSLLLLRTARRRRRMHKLHEAHLRAAHSKKGR